VFELMQRNIYELIRGRRHYLNETRVKSYMYQLIKAMDHMHRNGIFHRDIKPVRAADAAAAAAAAAGCFLCAANVPTSRGSEFGHVQENILIAEDVLKLADFGSCRGIYSKQPYTEYISTRWYRAPECLLTDGYYNYKMDIWGVGCVFFEIVSLFPLFPGTNELDQINKIHKILGTPAQELLEKFKRHSAHVDFNFPQTSGSGVAKLIPHVPPDAVSLFYCVCIMGIILAHVDTICPSM
jgi:renal tumor antigen